VAAALPHFATFRSPIQNSTKPDHAGHPSCWTKVMTMRLLLTVWSIRLALLLFSLAVIARLGGVGRNESDRSGWKAVRAIWVVGCLLALVHGLAVFGYVMDWSHQAAVEDTIRRTRQSIGVPFGGGVYFNYAFWVIWTFDATWWCGWPDRYRRRSLWWDLLVIGYLWFIAFNATVVFESGAVRWLGLAATISIAGAGCRVLISRKQLR